jgi:glycosyltransferase involved in cell wall biosynthesis
MKVAVVTPTIGSAHLKQCVESIENQSYTDIVHYIFVDGYAHRKNVFDKCVESSTTKFVVLEDNVGQGWYGHRVYAACSFLVNADVICYLDEDNWFEPNHVQSLVDVLNEGNDWAYSLRKIYDKDGNYLCEDNCESLGKWPVYFDDNVNHIDTSSFAVRKDVAVKVGHAWYGQWGADRQFFNILKKHFPTYECNNQHTMSYRLDGNANSVTQEFFDKGNSIQNEKYKGEFPWKVKERLLQVGPGISVVI